MSLPPSVRSFGRGTGRTLAIGARPSSTAVQRAGEAPPSADVLRVPGRVYVSEQLGDNQLVTVQVGSTTMQAFAPHDRSFGIDEPVDLVVPDASLYVFEGEEQRTIRFAQRAATREADAIRALAS